MERDLLLFYKASFTLSLVSSRVCVCVCGGVLYPDDTVNLTPGECKLDNKAFRSSTIKHTQLCCTVSVAVFMQLYGAADT